MGLHIKIGHAETGGRLRLEGDWDWGEGGGGKRKTEIRNFFCSQKGSLSQRYRTYIKFLFYHEQIVSCFSFLWLPQWPQTWWLKRHLFSHSLNSQKSKVKVSAGPCSLQRLQRRILPCLSLQAPGAPDMSWLVGCITPVSASVFMTTFSVCIKSRSPFCFEDTSHWI